MPFELSTEYLSPQQAGAYLGVTRATLKAWRSTGRGPVYSRMGLRLIRYRRNDLDAYIGAGITSNRPITDAATNVPSAPQALLSKVGTRDREVVVGVRS